MSIVVGFGPEARGHGALELGRMLAGSAGLPLVVCCVIPDRWQSVGPGRQVDRDYEEYLRGLADAALADAARTLDDTVSGVRFEVVTARSAPRGLLQAAEEYDARLLVAGSSADGPWGHIALGSVSDRLLHGSSVPVALAPRGYRAEVDQQVTRVSVAVDGTEASDALVKLAAQVALDVGARLRIVTFAVRAGTMYPPEVGLHVEDRVVQAWREQATGVVEAALAEVPEALRSDAELRVAEAKSWSEALDEPGWAAGDVLVVGSSAGQPFLSRVFLGSTATRIVRHSPVPVVVVP